MKPLKLLIICLFSLLFCTNISAQNKSAIGSPNDLDILTALEKRFNKCQTSFIGTKACMKVLNVKLENCSLVSAREFSCKYRVAVQCTNNASPEWNRAAQIGCDADLKGVLTGIFRKYNEGWSKVD